MKKLICFALALAVAAAFVGCGTRNVSDHPGGRITDPTAVEPSVMPHPTMTTPTVETHIPTESTHMTAPTATAPDGPVTDATGGSTGTSGHAGAMP